MILDTCALLWLAEKSATSKISLTTLELINNSPLVYVSAISGFEIGIKVGVGKLILPVPPAKWFDTVLSFHHLELIDLDLDICLKATELPKIHKDPCDRFIIASALKLEIPIVTSDARFKDYGVEVLW
jgi:PIN domain nuclease of toxin-antitoxin system